MKPDSRLPDDENASTPDDEIDLEAWGPSTRLGLGERIRRRGRTAVTFGLLTVALFAILIIWSRQLALNLVTNVYVQAGAVLAGTFFVGMRTGIGRLKQTVSGNAWGVFVMPHGVVQYMGEFRTSEDGTRVFLPYRGIDFMGDMSRPLYLRELGEDVARSYAKANRDPEDPARIRVDDANVEVEDTAHGTVVGVICGGFEVDQFGRFSDVYASPPTQVTEENYRQLREQLEMYVNNDLPALKREIEMLEQQNQNLRQRLSEDGDERVDQFIERMAKARSVDRQTSGRRRSDSTEQQNGTGTLKDVEEKLEEYTK